MHFGLIFDSQTLEEKMPENVFVHRLKIELH